MDSGFRPIGANLRLTTDSVAIWRDRSDKSIASASRAHRHCGCRLYRIHTCLGWL